MALKRSLEKLNTTIEDYKGNDLRQIFIKSGFAEQSEIFGKINEVISDDSVTVKYILTTPKNELFEEFGFIDEENKKKFLKMRVILFRHEIKQKEPIKDIKKKIVEEFDKFVEVFQLLIQEIGFIDDDQSLIWCTYLEDNGINGPTFLAVDEDKLIQGLSLTETKIPVFKTLMIKIKKDEQELRFAEWKYATRSKYRKISEERKKTGGGPASEIKLSDIEDRGLAIWGQAVVQGALHVTDYEGITETETNEPVEEFYGNEINTRPFPETQEGASSNTVNVSGNSKVGVTFGPGNHTVRDIKI